MPIYYNKKEGWIIKKPTQDEQEALQEVGKRMIIEGLAGAYTNEKYKNWLVENSVDKFFNA